MKCGESHRYSSAKTVPSDVGAIDAEKIKKFDEVAHHLLQTVAFSRHRAAAVATQVIHQKIARARKKPRCAEIPERQIRAETMDQDQVLAIAELQVIELDLRGWRDSAYLYLHLANRDGLDLLRA